MAHYTATVRELAATLTANSYERAVEIVALPDLVRGYESVKLGNVEVYCDRLRALGVTPPQG